MSLCVTDRPTWCTYGAYLVDARLFYAKRSAVVFILNTCQIFQITVFPSCNQASFFTCISNTCSSTVTPVKIENTHAVSTHTYSICWNRVLFQQALRLIEPTSCNCCSRLQTELRSPQRCLDQSTYCSITAMLREIQWLQLIMLLKIENWPFSITYSNQIML